jgi:hypothetical protein
MPAPPRYVEPAHAHVNVRAVMRVGTAGGPVVLNCSTPLQEEGHTVGAVDHAARRVKQFEMQMEIRLQLRGTEVAPFDTMRLQWGV